jgi:hypothetical protein
MRRKRPLASVITQIPKSSTFLCPGYSSLAPVIADNSAIAETTATPARDITDQSCSYHWLVRCSYRRE